MPILTEKLVSAEKISKNSSKILPSFRQNFASILQNFNKKSFFSPISFLYSSAMTEDQTTFCLPTNRNMFKPNLLTDRELLLTSERELSL